MLLKCLLLLLLLFFIVFTCLYGVPPKTGILGGDINMTGM